MMSQLYQRVLLWLAGDAGGDSALHVWLEHSWTWPAWVTLLVVVALAVAAFALYATDVGAAGRRLRLAMAAARFAAVGIVLLMIAQWRLGAASTDLPYVVVLVDVSRSMTTVDRLDDEAARRRLDERLSGVQLGEPSRINLAKTLLLEKNADLLAALRRRYKLAVYLVAETAEPLGQGDLVDRLRQVEADGDATRLGDAVYRVLDDLRGSAVAGIVLLTDGINTEGRTLSEAAIHARRRATPLFTIGLGSRQPVRDLDLTDVLVEDVALVGDVLSFELRLSASGFEGRQVNVLVRESPDAPPLASKMVTIGPDGQQPPIRIAHQPSQPGDFEYVIEVEFQADEANRNNNALARQVSVRKQQIRVLLVQAGPSFEFRYLKHLLERDRSVDVSVVLQDADLEYADLDDSAIRVFPVNRDELMRFDVIVFGDVNPAFLTSATLEHLRDFVKEHAGGLAVIAGPEHTPAAYRDTPLAELLPIDLAAVPDGQGTAIAGGEGFRLVPTDLGLASPALQLGDSVDQTLAVWQSLPPLYWMLETPRLKRGAQVLAEHPTELTAEGRRLPLVTMQYVGAGRVLLHAIDATYLWRGPDPNGPFARYWGQTIRYLARSKLLGQDRRVEVASDRREYRRGMPVRLRVRFYAEADAPNEEDAVTVALERQGSTQRTVTLRRHPASRGLFEATVGQLAEGAWRARLATPALEGQVPAADFSVQPPPGESERLRMDVAEMTAAARGSHGKHYTFDEARQLLRDLPAGQPVVVEPLQPIPLWNTAPVLAVLFGLLGFEWLLRKLTGMM